MRIVLDTNVLVSGLLNPHGPPGRVLDLVLSGTLTLLFDDRILSEYREVLARPRFGFNPVDVETVLAHLVSEGEAVLAAPIPFTLPDPDDLPFLEVALAGSADALVTGNASHFKPTRGRHQAAVIGPAKFLARWNAR